TGLANSIEMANEMAKRQEEEGLEVFVKEWESSAVEISVTNDESDWFQSFHALLETSIKKINDTDQIAVDEWETLLKNESNDTKKVTSLKEKITPYTENMQAEADSTILQDDILNIWCEFELFFKK